MTKKRLQPGLPVSAAAHAGLLLATLLAFADTRRFEDAQEAVPVDIVTDSAVNEVMKGEKTAKEIKPVQRADKQAPTNETKPLPPLAEAKTDIAAPPPQLRRRQDEPEDKPEAPPPPKRVAALPPTPEPPTRPAPSKPEPQKPAHAKPEPPKPEPKPEPAKAEPPKPQAKAAPSPPEREPEEAEVVRPKPPQRPPEKVEKAEPEPPAKPVERETVKPEPPKQAERPKAKDEPRLQVDEVAKLLERNKLLERSKPERSKPERSKLERSKSERSKSAEKAAAGDGPQDSKSDKPAAKPKSGDETAPKSKFDAANIANLLSREAPQRRAATGQELTKTASLGAPTASAPRMSPTMEARINDYLIENYRRCWQSALVKNARAYVPLVEFRLTRNGALEVAPRLLNPSSDPVERSRGEQALAAIRRCSPMTVPEFFAPYYDHWHVTTFNMTDDM